MIPTVTTERLNLVPPTEAHLPAEAAFQTSERAHFVGGPVDPDKVWRIMAVHLGHWALRGYGSWVIEDRESGKALGMAGIWHPGEWPEPEVAYHLYEGAEGRGIATEAARAARDYAWGLGWTRVASFIDPKNIASQKVAARLGAVKSADTYRIGVTGTLVDIWRYERGAA